MSTTELDSLRQELYIAGSFETIAESYVLDYQQQDYERLEEILQAKASTGMQMGALLAGVIVELFTSFEFAVLPTPVVLDNTGKTEPDLTSFAQRFIAEQQGAILRACAIKNALGDAYLALNIDRNLEAISPKIVDPSFSYFSKSLVATDIIEARYIKNPDTGQKVKVLTKRHYDNEKLIFETVLDSKSKLLNNIPISPKIEVPNPIGKCPAVHLPNRIWQSPNGIFGWSDFFRAIPYFLIFHKALARGFESQQYNGRPVFVISGIASNVKQFVQNSFNIDIDNAESETTTNKIVELMKKNKMMFLSGDVKAQFIEAKMPAGVTGEILDYSLKQIARCTGIPEFIFGAAVESTSATVKEQYSGLKALVELKRTALEKSLRDLIRMAFVFYSTWKKNDETGEVYETLGLWPNLEAGNEFSIELNWPGMIGSDDQLKIDEISMLLNAGAMSRETAANNYKKYIPNAVSEIAKIEEEQKRFQPAEVPQTSSQKNSKQRKQDNEGRNRDNLSGAK